MWPSFYMTNVIHAFGSIPPDERTERMLEILNETLEEVKKGTITSLLVVLVEAGATQSNYTCNSGLELLGAAHRALHHIEKDIDNQHG